MSVPIMVRLPIACWAAYPDILTTGSTCKLYEQLLPVTPEIGEQALLPIIVVKQQDGVSPTASTCSIFFVSIFVNI